MEAAELEANAYAKQSGIVRQNDGVTTSFFGSGTSAPTITAANLAQVNETYTTAKAARIDAEQRWRGAAGTPAMQLREVQSNTAVQELQRLRGDLKRELADLQQRYDDDYPAVAEVQAQIAGVDGEISRLSTDIKSGIRREFEVAARQEQALLGERQRVSQLALGEQDRRVHFGILDREAEALRNQLANLLQRFNEIATAANVQAGTVTKLDEADIPVEPFSPNLVKNLLVALIAGIGLAGGLAVLRETFDERLRSLEEIEDRLGHSLLGHTPFIPEGDLEEQIGNPFSPLMESYSSILTSLDYSLPRDKNVLQFTSSQASEGKTTTAILLAKLLARHGRKTLLVDADLRKPSVAAHLGHSTPEVGFAEVVLGRTELRDALLPGMPENLDVLPVAVTPPNPVELLASGAVGRFIDSVRGEYATVIFDTSPVMGIADAPLISRYVDATIFIVEANRVQFGQARAALKRLRSVGTNVVGIVLTKYRALHAGQSYDYQYRYYHYTPGKSD
ncbi:MAG: polysaccharide biosynthesis tyrosine autokinase [Alphaproteobacteria bacterium]|nr:MAG: polysaccharide biosynthesis tyrosine autokinase [Alphaproteobacteria bacterium]